MKKTSLKKILTVNFVLTAMLPLVVIGVVMMTIMKSGMEKEIADKNFLIAKSLSGEVQKFLKQPLSVLEFAESGITGDSITSNAAIIPLLLEGLVSQFSYFSRVQILDSKGRVIYIAPFNKNYIGNDLSNHPYFQETLKSEKPYWSSTFISSQTGKPAVALGKQIKDGVIVGYLELDTLNAIIDKIKIGSSGYAAISDQDGTTIAHPVRKFVSERLNVKNLSVIRQGLAGKEGTFNYRFMETDKLGSVAIVPPAGWLVVVLQPSKEAFSSIKKISVLIWVGVTIAAIFALVAASLNLRKILTPLFQLSDNSKRIASGEYQIQQHKESYKEINELAASFAQMIRVIKSREEKLKESEKKYRNIFENTVEGIFQTTSEGYYISANPALAEIYGYESPDDLIDNLTDIERQLYVNPDSRKQFMNVLKKKDFIHNFETQIYCKDGSVKWTSKNIRAVRNEQDELICYEGSVIDISNRKQAEKALRESEEKLFRAKKMESLGLLAGGVAHDLNNVLSGIVSYPELILMQLPEDSQLRKPIATMQESGLRAAAIVQDLLTVARGVATAKEPLNLNDLVIDYLKSPEFKKLEQINPTVKVRIDLDTNLFNMDGSHVHIRKAVMNLVSNAAEAIKGGGNVTLSTVNRYIDRPLKGYGDVNIGEYAVLTVSDEGSGIAPDDLERIFEPFYTKKVMGRSGTGLGLAVVWNVVQDHKGYINVTTDENGTVFELYFPITRDKISGKDLSIPIKDYQGNGEMILVVDDVKSQREISCNMMDTLGYKTEAVSSGEEAVEYLKENSADLILLDMIMDPGINGRETYKRIKKIHHRQKAVILSGFAETDEVKKTQKSGAGRYLKKPVTLEKIGLAVKEELEKYT
ncbi:cache domain-containing protein [Desulfococcaceae bacterium HSG9]|nr:cache domain-containing protein [Desulfococcaceae bacterium HSG9]